MEFRDYQQQTQQTDQRPGTQLADIAVHLLGLAGEAGSVASEYKKRLRDGEAHAWWKTRMREEIGDVLWYLSALATHLGLDLDEVASANLAKTRDRWLTGQPDALDSHWPPEERLPRRGRYEFVPTESPTGRPAVDLWYDGRRIGDQLTDASHVDDGYRFHDAFHLTYAVLLGWSPVTRALMGRKRRSDPHVDENEDGGRAVVVEEGIAALAFGYAAQHNYLADVTRLDQKLLDTIQMVTGPYEVGVRSAADWERAILTGLRLFRELHAHGGGSVSFNADTATLDFSPTWTDLSH